MSGISYSLREGRTFGSGPTAVAAHAGDVRVERMAEFLGWCLGGDVAAIDDLLEELDAIRSGKLVETAVGINDTHVHVVADGARIMSEVVDLDLNDNPDGIAYTHAELEESLRWWREIAQRWQISRQHGIATGSE